MAKTETKFYICVHNTCPFETAKRKAIYTHLVRTHNERKEDYECEYCSTVYQDEQLVEDHLVTCHPDEPFTYTCVSRIENVINRCAKRGSDRNSKPRNGDDNVNDSKIDMDKNVSRDNSGNVDNLHEIQTMRSESYNRTKASVNESLNTLAARNEMLQFSQDVQVVSPSETGPNLSETNDSASLIDKTGGLKMKLNLKMIAGCSPRDHSKERSTSPPKLEPASLVLDLDSAMVDGSPPNIVPIKGPDGVSIREKSSKYFDRLEVYHTTDEHGRRCCPFCPYKTTKNTIRVHLSGIHKIYFVKCSLCEYKAAFPHQVTQHGVKFHKTTHLNVIQLSKESREKTILKLNNFKNNDHVTDSIQSYNYSLNSCSTENSVDIDIFEEENFSEVSSVISGDEETELFNSGTPQYERSYKAPKSQMSKTDYFSIKVENGIHLYSCNLCPFKTPVRATIYTHKYRHEDKTYRCGYCDFTSAPRSNVVHHLRSKHKDQAIIVTVVNEDEDVTMNTEVELHSDLLDDDNIMKQEQSASPEYVYDRITRPPINDAKDQPTIIKVPQFKRTLTSVSDGSDVKRNNSQKRRKTGTEEYKLSLNKLYKVNPSGSPKYICVECDYGCDTHPKMKHHLYRHRPQQYKCPYCDHRKYPRSYVVRHVRDTHRDKPVRVIDLSIGPDPIDIPEYMEEHEDDRAVPNDLNESMDTDYNEESDRSETNLGLFKRTIDTKTNDLQNDERLQVKVEPDDMYPDELDSIETDDNLSNSLKSQTRILNNVNETSLTSNLLDDSNDVNPNFSEVVYTSAPLIESLINGQFPGSTSPPDKAIQRSSVFKKKSMKEYRINYGDGPKYICNICGYGTENYKTIHNHMYRHESQKYQCPYCGYRRSPKSFVENHIREVHRGHPLFVTELNDDLEQRVPLGSPRQCVMMKQQLERPLPINRSTKDDLNLPSPSKLQVKWPAPKPATQINLTVPIVTNTQPLQIPVRPKGSNAGTSSHLSDVGNISFENGTNVMNASVLPPNVAPFKPSEKGNVLPRCAVPKTIGNAVNVHISPKSPISCPTPFKFKEPSRTTFKTMYKCVFDPESCNHISKDKSKMKQHLFMHVEYKPWSCDLCEMTASQSSHIKNHVRTEHYGVSDMSFKYKKHNYLEKHIETFLTKGLFTVPVTEYRMIMDMKGNTKVKNRASFTRDSDGFVMCPHCDYKTKSGSMTDHVKMKHMQPRFKCHWCTFKAFYRAEIRRHHRKEKTHRNMEFRIQELDLKEVAKEFSEGKTKETHDQRFKIKQAQFNGSNGLVESDDDYNDDDDDDDDGDDEDVSSNEDLSDYIEYSTGKVNTLILQKNKPSSEKSPTSHIYNDGAKDTSELNDLVGDVNVIGKCGIKSERTGNETSLLTPGNAKFKCAYCSFSAALRVKVKMHCNKKHTGQEVLILEPFMTNTTETLTRDNIMRVNCSELKGTKFEADLMKAGVSKLNLASLFPYRRNERKRVIDRDQDIEDNDDDDDDESDEETGHVSDNHIPNNSNAQLTIPFKKANEPSKIELLVSKMSNDKRNFDVDKAFKKPMDPVSTNKHVDKRREALESHKHTVCGTSLEESVKSTVCGTSLEDSVKSTVCDTSLEDFVKSTVCGTSLEDSVKSSVCGTNLEKSVKSTFCGTNFEDSVKTTSTIVDNTNAIMFEDIVVEPLKVDKTEDSKTTDLPKEASMVKSGSDLGRQEDFIQGIKCCEQESRESNSQSTDLNDRNDATAMEVSQTLLLTNSEEMESFHVVHTNYECSEMATGTDESTEPTEDDTTISIPALDFDIDTAHSPDDTFTDNKPEPEIHNTENGGDGILMDDDNVVDNIKENDAKVVSLDTLVSMGNFTKSIVRTTYPCGSPVVLEMDTEEEGQA